MMMININHFQIAPGVISDELLNRDVCWYCGSIDTVERSDGVDSNDMRYVDCLECGMISYTRKLDEVLSRDVCVVTNSIRGYINRRRISYGDDGVKIYEKMVSYGFINDDIL